jgi:hypothetical protein
MVQGWEPGAFFPNPIESNPFKKKFQFKIHAFGIHPRPKKKNPIQSMRIFWSFQIKNPIDA